MGKPQIRDLIDVLVVVPEGGLKRRVGTVESFYTDDEGQTIVNMWIDWSLLVR